MFEAIEEGRKLYEQKFVYCGFYDNLSEHLITTLFGEQYFVIKITGCVSGFGMDYSVGIDAGGKGHGFTTRKEAGQRRDQIRRKQKGSRMYKSVVVQGKDMVAKLDMMKNVCRTKHNQSVFSVNLTYSY